MTQYVEITVGTTAPREIQVGTTPPPPNVEVTVDPSSYYVNLAKDWATKMSDKVANEDYSSKYYAENAKISAETAKMEASTATGLKDLLKEDFDEYTESLNNTKNLAIEEINTTSTVAIGNINTVVTSSTEQINAVAKEQTELVDSTANKALEDIATLATNSEQALEILSATSTEEISVLKNDSVAEINTLGNTIKSDATDWIDVINATGKSYNMVTHRQITNCITEIPQDIKLELNNGSAILKAGSKIYYDGEFIITDKDYSFAKPTGFPTEKFILAVDVSKETLAQSTLANTGSHASHDGTNYKMWFNTSDNKCYVNSTNGIYTQVSYPIAVVNCTSGSGFTSIDQTFNGFGYIGSTVFVLPNVKCLIPNGRKEDGSLNNIEFVTEKIYTREQTTDNDWDIIFTTHLFEGDGNFIRLNKYYEQEAEPSLKTAYWLNPVTNRFYKGTGSDWVDITGTAIYIGKLTCSGSKISLLQPKQPFRAVDYSEFQDLSGNVSTLSKAYITETYRNGGSWYRVYSDGFCVQGSNTSANATITLFKSYPNINYVLCFVPSTSDNATMSGNFYINNKKPTSFTIKSSWAGTWYACGYIS